MDKVYISTGEALRRFIAGRLNPFLDYKRAIHLGELGDDLEG